MTYNPLTSPVDKVVIAGHRSPGIATVKGADSPRRIVTRAGFGLSGATARYAGRMLSEPVIELRLYNTQHWSDWASFQQVISAPPLGERGRAFEVEHPILADLGIRSVLIKNVHQPVPEGESGVHLVVIETIEFRRPVFAASAPDGAQSGPEDPVEIQIQALEAERDRLAGAA